MHTISLPLRPTPHDLICPTSNMIVGYIIFSAAITVMVAAANQPNSTAYDVWIMLTLAGAMVASSTAFLVHPLREAVGVKIGRALASGFTGVVGSRVVYQWWDTLRNFVMEDKVLIFGLGFSLGMIGFIFAVVAIKTAATRAPEITERLANKWDGKYMPPQEDPPTDKITHASTRRK